MAHCEHLIENVATLGSSVAGCVELFTSYATALVRLVPPAQRVPTGLLSSALGAPLLWCPGCGIDRDRHFVAVPDFITTPSVCPACAAAGAAAVSEAMRTNQARPPIGARHLSPTIDTSVSTSARSPTAPSCATCWSATWAASWTT
jgi:hypothetical protein